MMFFCLTSNTNILTLLAKLKPFMVSKRGNFLNVIMLRDLLKTIFLKVGISFRIL